VSGSSIGQTIRAALLRVPRRMLAWLALSVAVAGGATACSVPGSGSTGSSLATVAASRGNVVVTVGGVGRITEASTTGAQISVPSSTPASGPSTGAQPASAGSTGGASAGTGSSAPADAVFPRASGRVAQLLVTPGQHVASGQALALLDDGGVATGAVLQAQNDLATARLELRQKQTSDPLRGLPPTPEELAAGRVAVLSAKERLGRLLGPPLRADVTTARADLARAKADLEILLGGTQADRAEAIAIAEQNVQAAQQRLDHLLGPPDPADVAAAQFDLLKAEADLADLLRTPPPPPPETLGAAQQAVVAARLKLAKVLAPAAPADVTAARLDLARGQADLRRLRAGPSPATVAAARQAVDAARARLARLQGPPLMSDVTSARLDIRKAEADLAVLRARGGPASSFDLGLAQLKIEAARARLALARFTEEQLTVRAPASGTVTGLLTVTGAPVDASTPVATVADLQHLAVSVDVSEFDAALVRGGLPAVVKVDALGGKPFPGKVMFVGLTGVDNGGVVTFPVRVGLSNVADLKPGMNVSVRVIVAKRHDVVRVPLEAVARDDNGHPIVNVLGPNGRSSTRRVKLGLANNKDVEVVRGLRAGERVALAASQG
jgi:multidrug efflux pump subunit AcrA (membrane-fusion protein)